MPPFASVTQQGIQTLRPMRIDLEQSSSTARPEATVCGGLWATTRAHLRDSYWAGPLPGFCCVATFLRLAAG